jgi:hypothetical protein
MTAADNQAIRILSDSLMTYIEENRSQHDDIKAAIKDLEVRLVKKIEAMCGRLSTFEDHCRRRNAEIDAELAERKILFELEIAEAKSAAVKEAKAPSVYRQASAGLGRLILRTAAILSALAVVGSVTLAILEWTGLVHW